MICHDVYKPFLMAIDTCCCEKFRKGPFKVGRPAIHHSQLCLLPYFLCHTVTRDSCVHHTKLLCQITSIYFAIPEWAFVGHPSSAVCSTFASAPLLLALIFFQGNKYTARTWKVGIYYSFIWAVTGFVHPLIILTHVVVCGVSFISE